MVNSCDDDATPGEYKPSVFYFRRSLRAAPTLDYAIDAGLVVCGELERLKAWVREQGLVPPRWVVDPSEAVDKGWRRSRVR